MGNYGELMAFELSVTKLGNAIKKASVLWQDENYRQLSDSVAQLGNKSRFVIETGRRSQRAVEEFERIANENY